MRHRLFSLLIPAALLLGLLTACGGASTPSAPAAPASASFLAYTDPSSTGWRLVRDSSSTGTRLVLNLVGPGGAKCRGVGFNLKGGTGVGFTTFPSTWHAKDTGVFELKTVVPDPLAPPVDPEPVLFAAGVKPGNVLTVGIFQKDRRATAKDAARALVQIAIDFEAAKAAGAKPGDVLSLAVTKARIIPEDIGDLTNGYEMMAKARMADISIAIGKLTVQ